MWDSCDCWNFGGGGSGDDMGNIGSGCTGSGDIGADGTCSDCIEGVEIGGCDGCGWEIGGCSGDIGCVEDDLLITPIMLITSLSILDRLSSAELQLDLF